MTFSATLTPSWPSVLDAARSIRAGEWSGCVYSSPEWLAALAAAFHGLHGVIIQEDGQAVAVLPLVLESRRNLLLQHRIATFPAAPMLWNPDVQLPRECWAEAAGCIAEALVGMPWDVLEFKNVDENGFLVSALFPRLAAMLPSTHLPALAPAYSLELPESEIAYTSTISPKLAREMRNLSNRLARCGAALEQIRGPEALVAFEEILALHLEKTRLKWGGSILERSDFKAFHRALALSPDYAIYRIRLDDKLMVGGLMVDSPEQRWVLLAGVNTWDFQIFSPQKLVMHQLILDAIRQGKRTFHLGGGTPEYKLRLGAQPSGGDTIRIFRSRMRQRLFEGELRLRKMGGTFLRGLRAHLNKRPAELPAATGGREMS